MPRDLSSNESKSCQVYDINHHPHLLTASVFLTIHQLPGIAENCADASACWWGVASVGGTLAEPATGYWRSSRLPALIPLLQWGCVATEHVKGHSVTLAAKEVLKCQDAADWYWYRGTQTLTARGPHTGSIWKMDVTLCKTRSIHVSQLIGHDIPKLSCRNDHTEKCTSTGTLSLMAKNWNQRMWKILSLGISLHKPSFQKRNDTHIRTIFCI